MGQTGRDIGGNMNIPTKLKIGGYNYDVELIDNLARDRSASGQSCMNDQWIHIDSTICQEQKESTFIHEILEQINNVNELRLEHWQICVLESTLYQIIKDNPDAFSEVLK